MPPPPTGKQKNKVVDAPPVESNEFVPVGDHERVLSIFVSGRFIPKDLGGIDAVGSGNDFPPQFAPAATSASLADNNTINANADGLLSKRSSTPTGGAGGKRAGTPSKKELAAANTMEVHVDKSCCALANGTYTSFGFAPDLHRPFFSLFVPGLATIGGGQPTEGTQGGDGGVPNLTPGAASPSGKQGLGKEGGGKGTAAASPPRASPIEDGLLRIIPKGSQVNSDGTFKIEMYRKKLRVGPEVVDLMLANRFRFKVHTVPDAAAMAAKYEGMPSNGGGDPSGGLNTTVTPSKKGGVAGKSVSSSGGGGQAGASGKNSKHQKAAVDPVEMSQDPLTVQWADAHTVLDHSFDLSNVLDKARTDRIELIHDADGDSRTALDGDAEAVESSPLALGGMPDANEESGRLGSSHGSAHGAASPFPPPRRRLDTHTDATREQLTKSRARRTVLYTQQLPGFAGLTISIVCTDPLLCPENVRRYMPMIVDIGSVCNLPPLGKGGLDLRHTMDPREDEVAFAATQHRSAATCGAFDAEGHAKLGGPRFAPVYVTASLVRPREAPLVTKSAPHARDITFSERFTLFLYKYSMLELQEHFFFKGMDLCLHDRDVQPHHLNQVVEAVAPPTTYGRVQIPLRGALLGETLFNINAQLVPHREVGSGGESSTAAYTGDYLSNATTIKAKVQLLAALPRAFYITPRSLATPFPSEGIFANKSHLTRALFILPYKGPNCQRLLQGLMGALIQYTRASESTGRIVEVPPERPPPPSQMPEDAEEAAKKAAQLQGARAKAGSAGGGGAVAGGGGRGGGAGGGKKGVIEEKEVPTIEDELRAFAEGLPPVTDEAVFLVPEGVSGFEVIDGERRIVCIEGYPHMLYAMVDVMTSILGPLADARDPSVRILFNTDLAFPQRWYHSWPSLVKPMPELAARMASRGYDTYALSAALNSGDGGNSGGGGSGGREASPQMPPPTRPPLEATEQSPKAKGDAKKNAKPPKLTPAQKQAIIDAEIAEQQRIEHERELAAAAEAEAARRDALRGERDELDSGGVGNRIRRIRLARSIEELCGQQRNFMRRFLSAETLKCISKLSNLRNASSLSYAVEHNFFPTAEELIALERVQGDSLEVYDICGSDTYYTFDKGMAASAITEAGQEAASMELRRRSEKREMSPNELLAKGIDMSHAGRMLTFIGTPAHPSQLARLPKLAPEYFPRHQQKNYMLVDGVKTASGGPLYALCAYPTAPPNQLLRYYCNAQVVGALERADSVEQSAILFVLHFETVARNGSDDRNPAYEEHLRREKRRADPREYTRIIAQKRAHYLATHSAKAVNGMSNGDESDEEDAPDFRDPPPFVPDAGVDKDELIENLLVRNDYVTLNRDAAETLKRWGRGVNDGPAKERDQQAALAAQCQQLYNAQSTRMAAIDAKVAGTVKRATHSKGFVSGAAKTIEEARRHPRAMEPGDGITDGPWVAPSYTRGGATERGSDGGLHEKPMSFSGGQTVVESTNLDSLLPPAFKARLQSSANMAMTKAEEAAADLDRARKDKDEWKARVVVDSTHFSVSTRVPRNVPMSSIDQYQSILEDEPKKLAIKRNYAPPPPPSIRTAERVVPNERVEPYESKHPEQRTFYQAKGGVPNTFLKDIPMVTDAERMASPLYRYVYPKKAE